MVSSPVTLFLTIIGCPAILRPKVVIKPFINNYDYLPNHGDIFKIQRTLKKTKLVTSKLDKKGSKTSSVSPKTDISVTKTQRKAFKITKTPEKKMPDEV